jgi:hypothetical protein
MREVLFAGESIEHGSLRRWHGKARDQVIFVDVDGSDIL